MTYPRIVSHASVVLLLALTALVAFAADYPAPKEGDWVVRDFRFHTGDVLPELRLHYTTVGEPSGEPVLVLHGTTGSGAGMLSPAFAGELFGPGQPLDAQRYFIILTDAIGTAMSMKPGYISAHIQVCMPPIELPITRRRWRTLRCSVTSRYCARTMSS